ncbi:MAG: carbohydrate kinase family protein [Proteobacteria bacterium]|nr:carbohydrate kinase family protein [Pseudomonadota bacterium]
MDILMIGDSTIDEFLKIDEANIECEKDQLNCKICLPFGSKISVSEYSTSIAGNSINTGVGLARLGLKVYLDSEIGNDAFGNNIIQELYKRNVDTTYVKLNANKITNVHQIIFFQDERTILTYHEKYDYELKNWREKPKMIHYSSQAGNFEAYMDSLIDYLKNNRDIISSFNPGSAQIKLGVDKLKKFFEVCDILFVNEEEARLITTETDINEQHRKLEEMGIKMSVITCGKKGSSVYSNNENYTLGILEADIEIKDKTGAGDSHSAGFLAGIFYGKSMEESLKWGTINSAYCLTEVGAVNGLLKKEEVEQKIISAKFKEFYL